MASMYVEYAIRNVQTGNFVNYMSDDGTQYEETDILLLPPLNRGGLFYEVLQ